jgi:hypothetical protein
MSFKHHNITGSRLLASPSESHEFSGGPNDFNCAQCGRPRALHQQDGFKVVHDFREQERLAVKWRQVRG